MNAKKCTRRTYISIFVLCKSSLFSSSKFIVTNNDTFRFTICSNTAIRLIPFNIIKLLPYTFNLSSDCEILIYVVWENEYKVKIIDDKNKNGKWDSGDYLKHIQPEKVEFYPDDIAVRANWDVEIAVTVPIKIQMKN